MKWMILCLMCVLVGCNEDGGAPAPAPAIDLTLTATDSAIGFGVRIPQNMAIQDQNTANFVYVTAINSGLASIQQAAQIQAATVEERRQSWQTFWLGLFTFGSVVAVCLTTLIKGVVGRGNIARNK